MQVTMRTAVEHSLRARIAELEAEVEELRYRHDEMKIPPQEHRSIFMHPRVRFTNSEIAMLGYMLQHPNLALTKQGLLASTSQFFQDRKDGPDKKCVDARICYIRRKLRQLRDLGIDVPFEIETVWGVGYGVRLLSTTDKLTEI